MLDLVAGLLVFVVLVAVPVSIFCTSMLIGKTITYFLNNKGK